ncbi:hypothetical protein [Mesorhizobium sp. WSM3882]|uniref:hypothetical protein n=1 Tax=Mesorhizobium sp. WSM3882 TaxID=2029407 RepID=UPI000BAF0641|nr:hypothetical protein [Mesorhizobium sp. WSM3882]PBB31251.1 hypothetical protein CK214_16285 [Mesorhizobium sp. WSM3882]
MNLTNAVPYVTNGLSLIAFIVAAISFAYRAKLRSTVKVIEQAPSEDRLRAIGVAAGWLGVDLRDVPEHKRYDLIMREIKQRERRDIILGIVSLGIALVIGWVAVTSMAGTRAISAPSPVESRRDALLLGYDAAICLGLAVQGQDTTQQRAGIDERVAQLGVKTPFPQDPLGPKRDAEPASRFAQQVSGTLEQRDQKLARAFQLGWLGVISLRGGPVPQGFSIGPFAEQAGFNLAEAPTGDEALLEWLVKLAREGS